MKASRSGGAVAHPFRILLPISGLLLVACGGGSEAPAPDPLPPPAIRAFGATPPSPAAGQPVRFSWSTEGATRLSLEGPGGSLGPVQGTGLTYIPARSGAYTLRAENEAGATRAQVTLTVGGPDPALTLFPWTVPWDDASPTATDLSGLIPRPAGAAGFVRVQDGHLATDSGRIRFWGTNTTFQANFPTHAEADALSAHLAKGGVNLVRFHHMDTQASPGGIWTSAWPDRVLDPGQVDKLDYFISRLKACGIYADLNLLVGRPLARGTDLPADIDQVASWKVRHALGFFDPQILQLQKDYATALMSHVNPYTGLAYSQEPAVALVEIHNENGLAMTFRDGQLDALPPFYQGELKALWNAWLKRTHGAHSALSAAWGARVISPAGAELLQNVDFASGLAPWNLEQHETARASAAVVTDEVPPGLARSVKLQIQAQGTQAWHIQFNQGGLALDASTPYTATFWARSDRAQAMTVGAGMAHAPWSGLGFDQRIALDTTWRAFTFAFAPGASDPNARLNFGGLGLDAGTVWISAPSLRPGGYLGLLEGEDLDAGTVGLLRSTSAEPRTLEAWRDWFRFLADTETAYWTAMRTHLKEALGVKQPILGTCSGFSTPSQMAPFDVVDTHAYWQHPVFPGTPWDSRNWYVGNRAMVNHPDQATIPGLSMQRILGKPHTVTEYDHPAPNTFQAEGLWTLGAYAALQDFDAVLQFDYAGDRNWARTTLDGYFDLARNPVQMTSMTAAAAAFLRGDVAPALQQVVAPLSREDENRALATRTGWWLPDGRDGGMDPMASLVHRTALATDGMAIPPSALSPSAAIAPGPVWTSDTGELKWNATDPARGVLAVDAPRTRVLSGFLEGQTFTYPEMSVFPCPTLQQGFCALAITVLEGPDFGRATRLLVSALGTQQNPGAAWAIYPSTPTAFPPPLDALVTFAGNQWGQGPTEVEGITAELSLALPASRVRVLALDETGTPRGEVPVHGDEAWARVVISPVYRTLLYEVRLQR